MSGYRRVGAAALVAALTLAFAPPAGADTRDQLRHQRHQASRLDAKAEHQATKVAAARDRLRTLDEKANAALAELQSARLAAERSQEESDAAQEQLAAARQRTEAARDALDEMAAGAYRNLAAGGPLATTLAMLQTQDPRTFLSGLQMLGQVGNRQAAAIDDLRVAEAEQLRTEHVAAQALARAQSAADTAAEARQRADSLVHRQQQLVAHEHDLLEHTRAAANQAHARAKELERKIARARARAAAIRRAQERAAAVYTGPIPTCDGGSVSGHGNGELPVSALCPLWGAPGQMLRADSAAAFNRMSKAYSQVFGVPLCVTSSYRTYQRQVELYATMPAGYAAVPGTSNHGWGLAVDLCGGIQVDGSGEHQWLLNHAAAFGWFHPAWALPGGPGPHEPWHWEFSG